MSSQLPGVSFLMAAKNAELTVRAAVDSALAQDYGGIVRLIAVDDGSSDGTRQILSEYGTAITLISYETSVGRSAARNRALQLVGTPLIAIQDADDVSMPYRLSITVPLLTLEVGVAGGQVNLVDAVGRLWGLGGWPSASTEIEALFRSGQMGVAHPTMVMRTELIRGVGGYDDGLPFTEDLDLMMRLVPGTRFAASSMPIVHYRRAATDRLSYLWKTELWRRRVIARYGLSSRPTAEIAALGSVTVMVARQRVKWALRQLR